MLILLQFSFLSKKYIFWVLLFFTKTRNVFTSMSMPLLSLVFCIVPHWTPWSRSQSSWGTWPTWSRCTSSLGLANPPYKWHAWQPHSYEQWRLFWATEIWMTTLAARPSWKRRRRLESGSITEEVKDLLALIEILIGITRPEQAKLPIQVAKKIPSRCRFKA